ncbi:MAG: PIN domain-containing protein [Nostoc sp. DedQUE04]|uniref:type II toxin-antitoxin system VapC family toxin n=1 Tax=Nostoc sp. DedQUE04 TaxID=3075390 RepID=UPI002AD20CD5|nr:PIN domain-containing protein [Nostoc sp. DedQUE04]MDZ8136141.1 PIN domain-containing protein [Nostoc sp. DedQUE04]
MIIVDTGFFVALGNQNDQYHQLAVQVLNILNEPLVTTYPVITETCYLLARGGGNNAQCSFLREVAQEAFEVFNLQSHHVERMVELIEKYADLPMDMADASLVVLAEHLGHGQILTLDRRDFNTYRWNNSNPFKNLLLNFE